eukprot:1716606-Amphidinium_carterae.2
MLVWEFLGMHPCIVRLAMACQRWHARIFDVDTPEQGAQQLSWKCYRTEEKMKWEVRRIIPVAGYTQGTSTYAKLYRHISEGWASWQTALAQVGLVAEHHMGKSNKALKGAHEKGTDQEHWFSTSAVVWLLVHWSVSRRLITVRQSSTIALTAFLRKLLGVSTYSVLGAQVPNTADCLGCEREAVEGVCCCVTDWLRHRDLVRNRANSDDVALTDLLQGVAQRLDCHALCTFTLRVLGEVADRIDSALGGVCKREWKDMGIAHVQGPVKKLRIDQHVRMHVVEQRNTSHAKSLTAVAEQLHVSDTTVIRTGKRYMCSLLHDMRLAEPQTLSLCWDAARVGHPKREHVLFAYSSSSGANGVLPPQDLRATLSHQYLHRLKPFGGGVYSKDALVVTKHACVPNLFLVM